MEKHLFSRDRQTVLDICQKHEPRAFEEDPLGELDAQMVLRMDMCFSCEQNLRNVSRTIRFRLTRE